MKRLVCMFWGLFMFITFNAFALNANHEILGMWRNEEGSRIIEFVQNGAVFDAIIRKAENPSLVGKRQISGLKLTGKDQYDEGMLHLFKRDKTAKCSIKMVGADKIEIKASIGLMAKSQIWVKSK
ncbi:DUF2147 domain-containing protein [Bacteroidaceae bacterium HV4-6-C5C]|nr:DUF2147 domain-containing protein [Bacteroidaceae bacterium HV4-6-C5C]